MPENNARFIYMRDFRDSEQRYVEFNKNIKKTFLKKCLKKASKTKKKYFAVNKNLF